MGVSEPSICSFSRYWRDNCIVKTEPPLVSGFQPIGVPGAVAETHFKSPPLRPAVVEDGVGAGAMVVGAGLVGVKGVNALVVGVVVLAVVVGAVVEVGAVVVVLVAVEEQPETIKAAQVMRRTRGIKYLFTRTS